MKNNFQNKFLKYSTYLLIRIPIVDLKPVIVYPNDQISRYQTLRYSGTKVWKNFYYARYSLVTYFRIVF